jgi:phospholipid/cholesterol/gamma-HCH transport system ATP-binding protein
MHPSDSDPAAVGPDQAAPQPADGGAPVAPRDGNGSNGSADDDIIIRARDVTVSFGTKTVLDGLSLDVRRGEILGFVGGSGQGKSVLLRTILGLNQKQSGTIEIFGTDYEKASDDERLAVEQRWGVLFQQGALFSSLSVLENIQVPMREYLDLSPGLMDEKNSRRNCPAA